MPIIDIFSSVIPSKLAASPELAKELTGIIHFDIRGEGGGKWTLDASKPSDWVSEGNSGEAKMTVVCSADDLEKIVSKKLNPQMAAMGGKLKFKPLDMGLAMKLAKLIG